MWHTSLRPMVLGILLTSLFTGQALAGSSPLLCEPAGATGDQRNGLDEVVHLLDAAPDDLGDGLPVSTLASEGFSPEPIREMIEDIRNGTYINVDSVLIARHGRLVFEAYFNGFDQAIRHQTRSAFKSVTSTLVGIAIDQGRISGVDVPLSGFFPDDWPRLKDDRVLKDRITLAHMLTMSPGFDAEEAFGVGPWREDDLWRSDDWVRYALSLPMAHAPGLRFQYSSATTFLIGEVVAHASGMPLPRFARINLFEPLGITNYCWTLTPRNRAIAMGSFHMRPRDMLKIGQLFLDRGVWKGQRIVSEGWVQAATRHAGDAVSPRDVSDGTSSSGYGYQWWTQRARSFEDPRVRHFYASGNGGQEIFVFPELDLVVVFTGSNYNTPIAHRQPREILFRSILFALL